MIERHPVFKKPENENVKIWRYMSFPKYVSLLDKSALFFARVDQLEDKFEAKYPRHIFDPLDEAALTSEQRKIVAENKQTLLWYNDRLRRTSVVNCWHINDYESDAMWKAYLKGQEGVAIQSTYQRLVNSFSNYTENEVYIGLVSYIDHEKDLIPWQNALEPLVHKNKCFEHDKELRVVLLKDLNKEMQKNNRQAPTETDILEFPSDGIYAKIDVDAMVEQVIISPKAEQWFDELVPSITEKYGLHKVITKSFLA
jgi:hypothetical protein